mmetsp:Transcript_1176/g.1838  ORF Transcript_1176/g.1838 Transcript_1176/m.1838 type:complete len:103 (-) Transcript_1176:303-611(-)
MLFYYPNTKKAKAAPDSNSTLYSKRIVRNCHSSVIEIVGRSSLFTVQVLQYKTSFSGYNPSIMFTLFPNDSSHNKYFNWLNVYTFAEFLSWYAMLPSPKSDR